jgi:hypothetical protein
MPAHRPAGAALVIGLLLLTVITVLAISVISTASLELQMTGNEQYQEQAFRAAEAGIEQAIAAGVFDTDPAAIATQYTAPTSIAPIPQRGAGTPIAGCPELPGATPGPCEYFLRFDHATGPTAIPGAVPAIATGLRAYHFVVDSFGVAGRGAQSHQVQGFYIVGASADELSGPPVRTDWYERGIDPE